MRDSDRDSHGRFTRNRMGPHSSTLGVILASIVLGLILALVALGKI
jgi:hypothetical protein